MCVPCQALTRTGFINYYGLQRFGSYGEPTNAIGRWCTLEATSVYKEEGEDRGRNNHGRE